MHSLNSFQDVDDAEKVWAEKGQSVDPQGDKYNHIK
jgi:hypothetical protein